jgi:hypothetical protein
MKYFLNLTKVKKFPKWYKDVPLRIPIKKGEYSFKWQVLRSEMKKKWYLEMVKIAKQKNPLGDSTIPMGVDLNYYPKEAFIEEIK